MIIKIDYREDDLHMCCVNVVTMNNFSTPIKIVSENIPLGDIIICEDNGKERIIIERKTLNDLAASICDGRYKEQSFRLQQCSVHNHNIYYLLEGQLKSYKTYTRIDKRSLLSSMVSISHFKGFSIHKTSDIQESAEWIIQMAEKMGREIKEKPFYTNISTNTNVNVKIVSHDNTSEESENVIIESLDSANEHTIVSENNTGEEYSQCMKRIKKNNITPENIGEIMLSQIPNVSISTAIHIMKKYKNIASLINALRDDDKCLDNITIESSCGGKERRINKTSISSIRKYLLQ
jgi:ERCC4-type nuclease